MNVNYGNAIAGGLAGTMGGNLLLGWMGHFMIGTKFALVYAAVASRLPGAFWLRGAVFAVAPWLLAHAVYRASPAAS